MTWEDEDIAPRRPWLITLADLTLLLLGFFVLLQANHRIDPRTLAAGIRAGFGATEQAPPTMTVDIAVINSFSAGSALPLHSAEVLNWARAAARDPRTRLRITGEVDGNDADVDATTHSGPILAADRARAVAALLVRAGAVSPDRIEIATGTGHRRVLLTLGFDGGRQ